MLAEQIRLANKDLGVQPVALGPCMLHVPR